MIEIQPILCPTDFSEASLSALPYAVEIARLFNAQIFVIYVVPPPPPAAGELSFYASSAAMEYIETFRSDADKQIDPIIRERIPEEVKASKVLKDGDAASEILQAVDDLQIDLVTIATHGRTGWHHLVFGSVAEKVIRICKVPVLTVREKDMKSEKSE
jgi:nucleotide-binding universal stress UspA family protein